MKLNALQLGLAKRLQRLVFVGLLMPILCVLTGAENADTPKIQVANGVVLPRRPVADAIAEAMQFLKKADGAYMPGHQRNWTNTDGELAGYFTSAFVNEDGSRTDRQLAFPARQHAYFMFTFLRYYAYTGEREWLLRARDLADW